MLLVSKLRLKSRGFSPAQTATKQKSTSSNYIPRLAHSIFVQQISCCPCKYCVVQKRRVGPQHSIFVQKRSVGPQHCIFVRNCSVEPQHSIFARKCCVGSQHCIFARKRCVGSQHYFFMLKCCVLIRHCNFTQKYCFQSLQGDLGTWKNLENIKNQKISLEFEKAENLKKRPNFALFEVFSRFRP